MSTAARGARRGPFAATGAGTVAGVAALALVWLAATAWVRPLMLPDEGRYVGVAYEMLRSGQWLTPTLDGLPFFHKPPLFYWITAASMSVFGHHEAAFRAAPIVGAWAGSVALWLFARRWCGDHIAMAALLALLAQPLVLVGGQFANLDMLVAGCITVSIVLMADAVLRDESGDGIAPWLLAGAWLAMGLGVLAKGLIGIVIPALVIGAALLLTRRLHRLRALVSLPGIALLLAVTVPWFAAMQAAYPDFLHYFFVVQHFQRYAGGGFNNVQPVWFYAAVLLLFCLPWLPWLWRAREGSQTYRGAAASGQMFRGVAASGHAGGDMASVGTSSFVRLLLWTWAAAVVAFFSLPQSKLVGYVLPALPPLALLAAIGHAGATPPTPVMRRLWAAGLVACAAVGLGTVAWLGVHPQKSTRPLGLALLAQHGPGEPVFMLGRYDYDVPVYAALRDPVFVVDDWAAPALRRADDWHGELLDAAGFAPGPAAQALLSREAFRAAVCSGGTAWVIGAAGQEAAFPFLAAAAQVATNGDVRLWKVDGSAPAVRSACAGTPNGGLPRTSPPPRPAARPPAPPDS